MSDVMFYGVLRMPYEMVVANSFSLVQFYSRAQEAANRVESAEAELKVARTLLREVVEEIKQENSWACISNELHQKICDTLEGK